MGDMHDHAMPPEDDAEACERMDERPWIRRWNYDTERQSTRRPFSEHLAQQQMACVAAFQKAFQSKRGRRKA